VPGEIRSLFLDGLAGRLEALLNAGDAQPQRAAVVCHPHPMFGGTMHNKVVYHAAKALNRFGYPVLRFNFRGAGLSDGEHDAGRGEQDDVRTALDWLKREFGVPIIFAGFSFGAAVGLRVACGDAGVTACVAIGMPVSAEGRNYSYGFLSGCSKPKLFVSGARDQYASSADLKRVVEAAPGPKKLVLVEGADHFFAGKLDQMRAAIEEWVEGL